MRVLITLLSVFAGLSSALIAQPPQQALQTLYEQRRWFELREAVSGRSVPALYAGAVASAFNRPIDAVRHLTRAIREAATPEAANEARDILANLYMRLGKSADMVRILDDGLAVAPSRADFRNVRQAFEPLRRLPNQSTRSGASRPFRCSVTASGVFLPAVVNGRSVEWLFDSAFSHTAMSESEARMVGIAVQGGRVTGEDFAGGTAQARMAIAERMSIGDAELRHVPVVVFPDSQPPFNEQSPGKRGAIGLPAIAGLQAIRWTNDGVCQLGPNAARTAVQNRNLAFDGVTPITRVTALEQQLEFVLDTGNQAGTQLWSRFARDFPEIVKAGRKGTKQVHQIGGSAEREIIVLPELRLRVGGLDTRLEPAHVFSPPIGNDVHHGNLGVDLLSQSAEVVIDFERMSLTLRAR